MRRLCSLIITTVFLLMAGAFPVFASDYLSVDSTEAASAEVPVIETDVTEPSDGCVIIGLSGTYITDVQAALDRINEIRLEACKEGVRSPVTGQPLTEADYVPIKWSGDLEYIARIRAAESALTIGHTRTNGNDCFAISSPNGKRSYGEVLAWYWPQNVVNGIDLWYREKADWVNNVSGKVTGHYTAMINPNNLYVGLGTFSTGNASYQTTTAGEFSSVKGLDETPMGTSGECVQLLELNTDYIQGTPVISGDIREAVGEETQLSLLVSVLISEFDGTVIDGLPVLRGATWSSDDPAAATVSDSGLLTGISCGETTIRAIAAGTSAELAYAVPHAYGDWVTTKEATCEEEGHREKVCASCHDKIEEILPPLGHNWDEGQITAAPTCKEEGEKEYTCLNCGETRAETVTAAGHQWNSEYTVDKEANCKKTGIKSIHCAVCGEIREGSETEIPKTEHVWGEGVITREATSLEEGERTYTCAICGETRTEVIPVIVPEPADYKEVEKWKEVAEALDPTIYTAESYAAVTAALEAVEEGKTSDEQAEVDAMAKAIEDAIAALVLKTVDSITLDDTSVVIGTYCMIRTELESNKYTPADLEWRAADESIATVAGGMVSGSKAGTTTITAKLPSGVEASCTVHVLFKDAANPAGAFFKEIYDAVEGGITTGYSDGTFKQDDFCTRGQAVTFLWRAAGKPSATPGTINTFKDIPASGDFYEAIMWAKCAGITTGYNETTFGTNDYCTRGQIVTFLWRAAGKPSAKPGTVNIFKDIPASGDFYEAIMWAKSEGITTGYNESTFGTNDYCTRGQIVTFIYRSELNATWTNDVHVHNWTVTVRTPALDVGTDFTIVNEMYVCSTCGAEIIADQGVMSNDHDYWNLYHIKLTYVDDKEVKTVITDNSSTYGYIASGNRILYRGGHNQPVPTRLQSYDLSKKTVSIISDYVSDFRLIGNTVYFTSFSRIDSDGYMYVKSCSLDGSNLKELCRVDKTNAYGIPTWALYMWRCRYTASYMVMRDSSNHDDYYKINYSDGSVTKCSKSLWDNAGANNALQSDD